MRMNNSSMPEYSLIETALETLDIAARADASEMHGHFCGFACVLGSRAVGVWLATLHRSVSDQEEVGNAFRQLDELARLSAGALLEGAMHFQLLLPDDEESLEARTEALAGWCSGFLAGIGEAAASPAARTLLAGDTAAEILADFAEIALAASGSDEAGEEAEADSADEAAYAELVEFVRVGVQLLFDELQTDHQAGDQPLH